MNKIITLVIAIAVFLTTFAGSSTPPSGASGENYGPPKNCIQVRIEPSTGRYPYGRGGVTGGSGPMPNWPSLCGYAVRVYLDRHTIVTRGLYDRSGSPKVYPELIMEWYVYVAPDGTRIHWFEFDLEDGYYAAQLRFYVWPIPVEGAK